MMWLIHVLAICLTRYTMTANCAAAEWPYVPTMPTVINPSNDFSIYNSGTTMMNSATDAFQNQFNAIAEHTAKMNELILQNNLYGSNMANYLQNTMNSVLATNSLQQLQIINDVMNMLQPDYVYDKIKQEKQIHEECISAAYKDLNSAVEIIVNQTRDLPSIDVRQMEQVKDHVLSAVDHLQDSCPLCRALKYAVSDANENLLPFVTVLSSQILKTLNPSLT